MKEEKSKVTKKNGTKKVTTKKTVASKSSTTKKATVTKKVVTSPIKKTTKKVNSSTSTKKTPVRKVKAVSGDVDKKQIILEPILEAEVKKEENDLNKDLIIRVLLVVSFTLIFILLIIGFVESMINMSNNSKTKVDSYIVSKDVLKESNIIDIRDARYKLKSLTGDYFIYVTYSTNNINNFEQKLVNILDKYDIKDKFYYIDANPIREYDNKIELANKYLGYTDVLLSNIPTIIYVNKDNIVRIENIITKNDNKMITIGDFQNLLDINEFKAMK